MLAVKFRAGFWPILIDPPLLFVEPFQQAGVAERGCCANRQAEREQRNNNAQYTIHDNYQPFGVWCRAAA